MKIKKILFWVLIIILLIVLIVGTVILVKSTMLNTPLFPSANEDYRTDDPDNPLNYVISAYNDVAGFPIFKPDGVINVYTLYSNKKILFTEYSNKIGQIYEFDDKFVIVFRGTMFEYEEYVDGDLRYYTYPGTNIKVHKGFYNYYSTVKDQIMKVINNTTKTINITGHSLGASLSLLLTYDIKGMDPTVTLFGCPKTGNKDFVDSINGVNLKNIVNYFDIVPEAPEKLNQMYAVQPIYIFGIEQDSDAANHSLAVYYEGMTLMKLLQMGEPPSNGSLLGGGIPKKKFLF